MSRKKKITIILAVCVIVYALIGFVAVPLILESMLPDKLSEALNRPVSIENIRLNPFTLEAAVEGFDIKDKNSTDPFVSFDELFINIQTMSLFKLGLVVKEVRLKKPNVNLVRISGNEFNFSDLMPGKKTGQTPEVQESPKKPFRFAISNIAIIDGNISFQDEPVQKKHTISPINFNLPYISNFEKHIDTYSEPMLTGKFNQTEISLNVDTKPFHDTLETIVTLSLSGFTIPYYFDYIPEDMVGFEISNGRLDVQSQISFLQENEESQITVQGTIGLSNLELIEKNGSKILTLPGLQIDVAPSQPLENRLRLASVKIQSPELSVSRNPEGIINLTTLGPKPTETTTTTTESPPEETAPANPFIIEMDEFLLDSGKILFTDFAAGTTAEGPDDSPVEMTLDDLMIKVSEFSNAPDKTAGYEIHAMINKEADIAATGQLGITPLLVETDFSLADLELAWGQPYIPDTVQLIIADGKFSTSGHTAVSTTAEGEINTTITGKAAINEFASMDSASKEAFVSWNTFSFEGIDVAFNPLKINTDKILFKDFKNQLVIFNDGTSNLDKIFVKPQSETDTEQKAPAPDTTNKQASQAVIPVNIGEVLLDNFDFRFIDRNIEPHFSTRLNFSEFRVTGLTSEDFKSADLKAKGKIDEYAPIRIEGSINPLKEDLFLDVTYSLSNMELSPLSPYTGKYIGRAIEKGKLSTDVVYKIDKKEINAHNKVLIDQFTLGQEIDSPDALNLPVGMAISLLKDRNGEINVALPISGRTDDPDFGFGKPLLKALKNMIVKAATSPFDLVSSVAGGGEELRYIEFEPATAAIDDAATEKLDAIIRLMFERPILKLDVSGYVDMETDRAALTDLMLARKVKSRKLKKDSSKDIASIDEVMLSPEEYQKLLKQVYVKEVLSDPEKKKALKPVKDPSLTIAEIETIIRKQITVTDAEMRLLARKRAQQVKAYLLQDKSVTADRLFLTEPKTLSPEKKGGFKAARVELNVR
ncbi:MAG: DUF748 domain-containing protein [Desulfobacteraceae bacterium]|nr:DUF748 domain-containing protein [Desulfobacteraceae bacterium]MBC2757585.1 DUF748 domain-containing protein [Desulfobacteraceae bacterium]